jgi:hypothetical protein
MKESYIYAGVIGFIYLIHIYFFTLERYFVIKVSNGFRYGLIFLMIKKILSLPQYTLKKA